MEMNDLKSNYLIDKLMKFPTHPNNNTEGFFLKRGIKLEVHISSRSEHFVFIVYLFVQCACGALELTHKIFVKNTANTLK